MWIAFLSALLDPLITGTALLAVFFVKTAMQLRVIVMAVAALLSLSELIGGLEGPFLPFLSGAAGAALAGLLIAECVRMIVAPAAALVLGLILAAVGWVRGK